MADLSEKEQLDQMRAWWSEYGNYVIGGIVAGIAIMIGVNQYSSSQVAAQTEASVLYESVLEAVGDGDLDDAESAAGTIYNEFESTVYPAQARLAMARLYMDKGRDEDAASALQAIVDSEPSSELGLIAKQRLAQVLLYQEKPQEVIDLLVDEPDSAFSAIYSEKLGDAYFALKDYEKAQEAYAQALAENSQAPTVDRTLVQMKIDDLPDLETAASDAVGTADDGTAAAADETAAIEEAAEELAETAVESAEDAADGTAEAVLEDEQDDTGEGTD